MISSFYLGIAGVFLVVLAGRVIQHRWRYKVAIGSKDIPEMERVIRAFGNYVEYTPIFFLLLFAVEFRGAPIWFIHSLPICFLAGRILHASALSRTRGPSRGRVFGMNLSFIPILFASFYLIGTSILTWFQDL